MSEHNSELPEELNLIYNRVDSYRALIAEERNVT
jgi:hypothetical protein